MKRLLLCFGLLASLASGALADVFSDNGMGSMEFVSIGHAGNAGMSYTYNKSYSNIGAVGYNYQIGKHEVTDAQWGLFTSSSSMWSPSRPADDIYDTVNSWGGSDKPAVQISWYEAAQFCNWMTTGTTTGGAYQFNGAGGAYSGMDRNAAVSAYGLTYVLPTVDEWHKAAFYNTSSSGFTEYANGTSTAPVAGVDANYGGAAPWSPWDVGDGTIEQNDTYNMMGNVWEWTETPINDGVLDYLGDNVDIRGGSSHGSTDPNAPPDPGFLSYDQDLHYAANNGTSWLGFRVAAVPEPASCAMILIVSGGAVIVRRWFSV